MTMKATMMRKGVWRSARFGLLYLFHDLHITNHPFPCLVVLKIGYLSNGTCTQTSVAHLQCQDCSIIDGVCHI